MIRGAHSGEYVYHFNVCGQTVFQDSTCVSTSFSPLFFSSFSHQSAAVCAHVSETIARSSPESRGSFLNLEPKLDDFPPISASTGPEGSSVCEVKNGAGLDVYGYLDTIALAWDTSDTTQLVMSMTGAVECPFNKVNPYTTKVGRLPTFPP